MMVFEERKRKRNAMSFSQYRTNAEVFRVYRFLDLRRTARGAFPRRWYNRSQAEEGSSFNPIPPGLFEGGSA